MGPRDIEDALKKPDPKFLESNAVPLDFCIHVITSHWFKGHRGPPQKDSEAEECFKLFDKRDRNVITAADIKPVLGQYLPFPPTDQDVADFISECDPNGSGHVTSLDFKNLYLS